MGAPVPDGIWLPDLCRLPRLLTMLGLAQLTVVLVMLVPMATPPWDGAQFVSASGYALWLALSVSVLLCAGRKRLSRLPMRVGATAALGLALTVAVIASAVVHGLFASIAEDPALPGFGRFVGGSAAAVVLLTAIALRYFYVTKTGERMIADLRTALFQRILTLDPVFFAHMRTGEVLSRLTTDIQLVDTLLTTSISYALRNFLTLIGGVALLFFVSPKLTGFVLLIVPVLIVPLFLFGRVVRRLTVQSQDTFAGAVGFAGESVDAIETVQAFGREKSAIGRFGAAVEEAFGVSLKRMRARGVMTAMIIMVMFGGVTLVLWLGAQDVISGAMTPGALIQFVLLSVFAPLLFLPGYVGRLFVELAAAIAASKQAMSGSPGISSNTVTWPFSPSRSTKLAVCGVASTKTRCVSPAQGPTLATAPAPISRRLGKCRVMLRANDMRASPGERDCARMGEWRRPSFGAVRWNPQPRLPATSLRA